MARIRSLKPRFWDSPDTARADLAARLLFMAMWNWADDSGRGTANLKELEAFAFPNDDVTQLPRRGSGNCAGGCGNCATVWRSFAELFWETVQVYKVDVYVNGGRRYYEISSFREHQSKDFKPNSNFPGPEESEIWDIAREYGLSPLDDEGQCAPPPPPSAQIARLAAENARAVAEKPPLDRDKDRDKDIKDLSDPDGSDDQDPLGYLTADDYPDMRPIYSASFEQFWQQYPRKVGKRKAFTAWKSARKRASAEEILIGAKRYAADPNRDDKFTKHPDGWLNRDGWLDEDLPGSKTAVDWESL